MAGQKIKKVEIKTKETSLSVEDFINSLADARQRSDSNALIKLMKKSTNQNPKIWGKTIVGFGNRVCTSAQTGRSVDWLVLGFAPRKANLSLYFPISLKGQTELLSELGKHKIGVGCLYIKRLEDVDLKVLEKLILLSLDKVKESQKKD